MNTPSETFLTVREHADALAHELAPKAWRNRRNEPLNQLLPAIWLDQFEDERTRCLLLDQEDVEKRKLGRSVRPSDSSARVLLYRCVPKGGLWVPEDVRKAHEGKYLWEKMAALQWDDYEQSWLHSKILYGVVIPGSNFERWKTQHWCGKKETRGRKKGVGSYKELDAPLIEKMKKLIDGKGMSRHAAALQVVDDAAGGRTRVESKIKRLCDRYKAKYR